MMKVRMKISFEACRANKTLIEFFLTSILKTYHERNQQGLIEDPWPKVSSRMIEVLKGADLKSITQ